MMNANNKVIEMHDTWLAVNSIIGCTNNCKYCFLKSTSSNHTKPIVKLSAEEAIACLFSSKYYNDKIPVCLLPNTDPFLNEANIKYLETMLKILENKKVTNPIVIITKCLIPDNFINYLSELTSSGMQIVVYLSLSGLSTKYEPNINHENIRLNFHNLASHGIRVIHYYRPFIPDNSDASSITNMLDFVNQYTNISVVSGLKVKPDFIDKLEFWDITKTSKLECLNSSGVWPKEAYDYFFKNYNHKQTIFMTNSCALSQALHKPSSYYNTDECLNNNHCSKEQRALCAEFRKNPNKNIDKKIEELLNKIGKYNESIKIIKNENSIVIKNANLTIGDTAYLTFMLGQKVSIESKKDDDNFFNSPLTNAKPYIVK